jgi:hypothetical protein
MRKLGVLVVIAVGSAHAGPTTSVDLDKDPDGDVRLAEAAGACDKAQPAFVQAWCHDKKPQKARFSRHVDTKAQAVNDTLLAVTLPSIDVGKGYIPSVIAPPIYCDADTCMHPQSLTVFVKTRSRVDAAEVASVELSFEVDGLWRIRQWWGPKATQIAIKLTNKIGTQIGEGTLLEPAH